jgi:hypothetical protein
MEWLILIGILVLVSWLAIVEQTNQSKIKRKMTIKEEEQYEIKE